MSAIAEIVLTYSDVFNGEVPNFESEIKKQNFYKLFSIICELSMVKRPKDKQHKAFTDRFEKFKVTGERIFKGILVNQNNNCKYKSVESRINFINNPKTHIVTSQYLLILLKNAIYYCSDSELNNENFKIDEKDYNEVLKLQLLLNQLIDDAMNDDNFDADHFIYSNYQINNGATISFSIARSYYIFEKLLKDKNNFDIDIQKEFKDYYSYFVNKYQYTSFDYLSVLFWELSPYVYNRNLKYKSIYKNKSANTIKSKVIDDLSKPISYFKNWAGDTKDNIWDFSKFLEFPFIKIPNNKYAIINDYVLENCFFEKLYWQLRNCCPPSDKRPMDFYGRAFEKYIQDLTEDTISKIKDINIINEFKIDKNVRSSDVYLKKGKELIAVECKGRSVLLSTIIDNKDNDQNQHKLFIDPILQADKFFSKIKAGQGNEFEEVETLYIISVTMSSINASNDFVNSCLNQINKNKICKESKYFYNMNVLEFEKFIQIVENGFDPFIILKEYSKVQVSDPFINNISSYLKKCKTKFPSLLLNSYDEFTRNLVHNRDRYK